LTNPTGSFTNIRPCYHYCTMDGDTNLLQTLSIIHS